MPPPPLAVALPRSRIASCTFFTSRASAAAFWLSSSRTADAASSASAEIDAAI